MTTSVTAATPKESDRRHGEKAAMLLLATTLRPWPRDESRGIPGTAKAVFRTTGSTTGSLTTYPVTSSAGDASLDLITGPTEQIDRPPIRSKDHHHDHGRQDQDPAAAARRTN
jgi:hypothetical protein